jgi:SRSO17 transposase
VAGIEHLPTPDSLSADTVFGPSYLRLTKTGLDDATAKGIARWGGAKGPRLYDWCYLELADLEVEEFYSINHGLWTRGLLIRRRIADGVVYAAA